MVPTPQPAALGVTHIFPPKERLLVAVRRERVAILNADESLPARVRHGLTQLADMQLECSAVRVQEGVGRLASLLTERHRDAGGPSPAHTNKPCGRERRGKKAVHVIG